MAETSSGRVLHQNPDEEEHYKDPWHDKNLLSFGEAEMLYCKFLGADMGQMGEESEASGAYWSSRCSWKWSVNSRQN